MDAVKNAIRKMTTSVNETNIEMKEMTPNTVEVDLDELRNRNMMEGKEVEMPTEVPEDSGALGEDGLLSPEQDGRLPEPNTTDNVETDDLLGLNEEQETELADLLEEDEGIDLFEATESTESFSSRFSNMFKDFFKSGDKYEGLGEAMEEGGIEMGEIGGEVAAETGAEIGTEVATEVAVESGTEILAEAGTATVATSELGPIALLVGAGVALGFTIKKLVDVTEKNKQIDLENRNIEDMRGYLRNIQNTKSREARREALDDIYSSDKGYTYVGGQYVPTAPIYQKLKSYADNTNQYIDHVNKLSNMYKKFVLNGNDPDGYDKGNSQFSKYKAMPLMSAGEMINTVTERNEPIEERIHDYIDKYYKAGEKGMYDGYLPQLLMRDNDMVDHYRDQAQNDEGYIQARTDYFIQYNIAKNKGRKLKVDLGEIPSPEYLETANPPFWVKYYTQHQKRFLSNDEQQIKESMVAYIKRNKKPVWEYKKPVMSERMRRGFQSAFEKRNGGIKLMKVKNDNPTDPDDDAPTSLPKQPKGKHIHGRDFRPVDTDPTDDDDTKNKKHIHGRDFRPVDDKTKEKQKTITPSIPIPYSTEDTSFKSGKEWDLDDREHTFSPHNAVHYLMLASLTYDIPVLYKDFTDVPPDFHLEKYTVKETLGTQRGTFFEEGREIFQTTDIQGNTDYNAFGFMFYDEMEDRIVIAVEGTDAPEINVGNVYKFLQDVKTDLTATFETYNGDRFHSGILNYALQLKDSVFEFIEKYRNKTAGGRPTEVVFCGHSLGAISSQFLMYFASIQFNRTDFINYSFGSPRGFSETMISKVNNQCPNIYRVYINTDPVVYLPPRVADSYVEEYIHAGLGYEFDMDGRLVDTVGDTLAIPQTFGLDGYIPFMINVILGGARGVLNVRVDSHSRGTIKRVLEQYNFKHDTVGHSVEPINKLIDKYEKLKSDHHTFTKTETQNIWKKNETESKYIPYYHRGEIGFQYIPPNNRGILGIYFYNDTEFRNSGDIKGFVLM